MTAAVFPSRAVLAKVGRVVDAHDTGEAPILIDSVTDPAAGVWSGMVPSATRVGVAYHVFHERGLGWRCGCQARTFCAHIGAAAVSAERGGFDKEDLT